MNKLVFEAKKDRISDIINTIENELTKWRVENKTKVKTMLAAEESVAMLIEHASPEAKVVLSFRRLFDDVTISLATPGEKFDLAFSSSEMAFDEETIGPESEELIRNIVLKSFAEGVRFHHNAGQNMIRLTTARSPKSTLYQTLIAFALSILLGIVMRLLVSDRVNEWISVNLLGTLQIIFMNGLKMIVAPVVFLSLVGSVAQFSNLRDVGRIGIKTVAIYFTTSLIAVSVGIGFYLIFKPGDPMLASAVSLGADPVASEGAVSLAETLKGIVPDNFLKSFVENNMLQLIFLAIISGVAINGIGEKGIPIRNMFDSLNVFFMKITSMFIKLVPLIVFCSMLSTILTAGPQAFYSVLPIFVLVLLCMVTMMLIYCLMVALISRLNPWILIKKYSSTMLQVFSLSSSNASISLNMDACGKKLGISPKIYNLTIPLGATLNMDGLCTNLSVQSLALAGIFGIVLSPSQLVQVALTIVIISMGMPGIPGTALIGLAMLLSQLGVPIEAMSLIMGIYAILDMFETASNCLGDVCTTLVVAKTENMLDESIYYS